MVEGGQAPAAIAPAKEIRYRYPPVGTGAKNLAPPVFFCYLYFIRTCAFVFIVLHFAFLSLQHTTHTSMPPAGIEPATPASDRAQTLALDRSATGICRFDPLTVQPNKINMWSTLNIHYSLPECRSYLVRNNRL